MSRPVHEEQETFNRRALLLGGAGAAAFLVLAGRMAQLQLLNRDELARAAEDNRFNLIVAPADRGIIFDRFGQPLALNRRAFRVDLGPGQREARLVAADIVAKALRLDEEGRGEMLREVAAAPRRRAMTLQENLTWEEFSAISLRIADQPLIRAEIGTTRAYPWTRSIAHLIGYVAKANEEEAAIDPARRAPGVRIGKEGLEKSQEAGLQGAHGAVKLEVDARGRVLRELREPELAARPGDGMVLSIDADLQQFAYEQFEGQSGAAVVMDVHSGELVVMTSAPGFDPNAFVNGIRGPDYKALLEDPYKPLYHKAVRGTYPPGSTFKMITGIAALQAGLATPEDKVFCRGFTMLGGARFHCHSRRGHGWVDYHDAVKVSCDIYFYEMARRAGPDRIADVASAFGFGQAFDIGLPGVSRALLPTSAWKQKRFGRPWETYDSFNYGIGQGFMTATPLQLAVMTARLSNGGRAVAPTLIREGPGSSARPPAPPVPYDAEWIRLTHEAMLAVANEAGGTARADLGIPGVTLAGKTGTSQVRRITMAERRRGVLSTEQLPWNRRNHALFVCYAPAAAPKYACSVVVEHGGGGSKAAAPRAREIMKQVLLKDPSAQRPFTLKPAAAAASGEGPA